MRITKPLLGTAAGGAALGATLAFGLTMASASTTSTPAARSPHTSSATSATSATPAPKAPATPGARPGHKCPHMSGSARSSANGMPTAY